MICIYEKLYILNSKIIRWDLFGEKQNQFWHTTDERNFGLNGRQFAKRSTKASKLLRFTVFFYKHVLSTHDPQQMVIKILVPFQEKSSFVLGNNLK